MKKIKISNKARNIIRRVVMLIALCVFGYASYELTDIYLGYKEGNDIYANIEEQFMKPIIDDDIIQETDKEGFTINNSSDGAEFQFDYAGLKKYNKEAIGWIKLDNGEYISYPILQPADNDKYLRRLINGKRNTAGSIFVDYRSIGGLLECKNPIIYGHNMRDLSMFGTLKNYYDDKEYYKEHPLFDIWFEDKHYKCYVFSIYHTNLEDTDVYKFTYDTDEEFLEYVQQRREHSIVDIDVGEITAKDQIITLSTCVRGHDEQRLILHLVKREQVED